MDKCRPDEATCHKLPDKLKHIESPVNLRVWQQALSTHPDQQFAQHILKGLEEGFRIGFQHQNAQLQQCRSNMANKNQSIVSEYLDTELRRNRLVKLSKSEAEAMGIHCSPIGVIPKKNKPGKWRLIVDLSSPEGTSVNDGVDKEMSSLSYTSVDTIASKVAALGRGAMLAKMDIKEAYRIIPIHPDDRYLLGMRWEDDVFIDKTLPFGLRSAPLIFSAVADALQYMMLENGATFVDHYVDDFVTAGAPRSDECASNARIMHHTCHIAGAPVEEEKSEGPATTIPFLGIEIDSMAMELRLPQEKLTQLQRVLSQWRGKKVCLKRDLLSIIGSLSQACKVVKSGRAFVRHLIDLPKSAKRPHHHIRLSREARSDIEWWYQFAGTWNGVSILRAQKQEQPHIVVTSDASGRWGCGAFFDQKWFQLQWASSMQDSNITIKELVPIVLAAAVWGKEWYGLTVQARCDNSAVVAILNWGNSQDPEVMHLIRCLAFIKAKFQICLFASHIQGIKNNLADALSRNNMSYFRIHHPQAETKPTPIPQELLDLTLISKPDWTSAPWTDLWSAIFAVD